MFKHYTTNGDTAMWLALFATLHLNLLAPRLSIKIRIPYSAYGEYSVAYIVSSTVSQHENLVAFALAPQITAGAVAERAERITRLR